MKITDCKTREDYRVFALSRMSIDRTDASWAVVDVLEALTMAVLSLQAPPAQETVTFVQSGPLYESPYPTPVDPSDLLP